MNSMLPTSRPRVGWSRMSSRRSRPNSRPTTTFCWLPPDSVLIGRWTDGRPDVEGGDGLGRGRFDGRVLAQDPAGERRAVVARQHEVVGHVEGQHQAEAVPIGGHEGDARLVELAGL